MIKKNINKRNWAKNKPRISISIDKETHNLLSNLALEHRVCLKDMIDIALVAYATDKGFEKQDNLKGVINE